ncbi:DUF1045 domain-containing protein [Actimicrobium antarcticum]|uniref:DUF1045 domain-containing protein n=1 Tax=Actimicrobium antarcticum TaxID=1051899 RepID=A0ABP7T4F7_9BURK
MTRYALYFAPPSASLWWQAGCRWLGRDPEGLLEQLDPHAPRRDHARRYGFHATLKAPFRLVDGVTEAQLLALVREVVADQVPLQLQAPAIGLLGDFLALLVAGPHADSAALAQRCVSQVDPLRAPPTPSDLTRRRNAGLTARQNALLQRWGYPYTEEEFRFHMTLSDSLAMVDPAAIAAMRMAAGLAFAGAMTTPLMLEGVAVFREDVAGAPFRLIARCPFGGAAVSRQPG